MAENNEQNKPVDPAETEEKKQITPVDPVRSADEQQIKPIDKADPATAEDDQHIKTVDPSPVYVSEEEEELEAQLAYQNLKRNRAKRKRKRIIIIAIVVVLAAIVVGIQVANGSKNAEDASMNLFKMAVPVEKGTFVANVNANGKTEPIRSSVVSPEVSGIITSVNVSVGQIVNEGDVVLTLRNDELDQTIRKANDALDEATRTFESADRKVNEAYDARQRAWDRANEADDWSLYAEAELNNAIADAEAAFWSADAKVNSAREDVAEAQQKADKRTVLSPMDGAVVAVNAQVGASVGGATGGTANTNSNSGPLVQISDLSQMKVTVQVNEIDISNVSVGEKAKVTFQALPGLETEATVQSIATVSTGSNTSDSQSSNSSSSGVVTYAVELLLDNAEGKLKPGMTASVSITTQTIEDAIKVPIAYLKGDDAAPYVLKVTDEENKQFEEVPVQVIGRSTSEAAVTGEVAEGDKLLMEEPAAPEGSASDASEEAA